MPHRFLAVLYDLDETLIASANALEELVVAVCAGREIPVTIEQIRAGCGMTLLEFYASIDVAAATELVALHRTLETSFFPRMKPYPEVAATLAHQFIDRKKLAIITNRATPSAEGILGTHNLRRLFSTVVGGTDVVERKPSPEGILLALERLEVSNEEAVMVGDSSFDVLAARAAGVYVIGVCRTHEKAVALRPFEPNEIVSDLRGARALIKTLRRVSHGTRTRGRSLMP
jgi:HAD superfamily hydrolase (TIGR01549 family)